MAFGIDDAVAQVSGVVGKVIDRVWPDPTVNAQMKAQLATEQIQDDVKKYLADSDLVKAQIAVDDDEAKSSDRYTSRARPTVIYGALGLVIWSLGIVPVTVWVMTLIHSDAPPPPAMDVTLAVTMLLGLLGLHTYENTRP